MAEAGAVAARTAVARDPATGSGPAAPYVERFRKLFRERGAGLAVDAADAAARAAALEELAATGFPLRHDEEWAHTPLRPVVEQTYRLGRTAAGPIQLDGVAAALVAGDPVALVTSNGADASSVTGIATVVENVSAYDNGTRRHEWHSGAGGSMPELPGVRVTPPDAASDVTPAPGRNPSPVATRFTRLTGSAFTRLARVFGRRYELHLDAAADAAPVHLVHLTAAGMLSAPRVRIRIAAGARVTLVETFAAANPAAEAAPSLTCGDTEIHVGAGAALTYVRVQAAAVDSFDLGSTTVLQERDSELHALSVAVGARLARHTLNLLAAGPGTSSRLGGAAVAGGTPAGGAPAPQLIDNHTYLEHAAPNCASRQLYKMVLGGGGHGVFSGRILVRPLAQQTDAFQLNQNLLLDDAVVDTKPQLEIGADDVRCTHGATTGRLNQDQMFYLQTRGIPRPAAGQMLARGFLDEVVGDLPAAALRPRLLELLHRRLDRLAWSANS